MSESLLIDSSRARRALLWCLCAYLALAWFGGGATVDVGATDEWLMLLSLPLILAASWWLLRVPPEARAMRLGVLLAMAVPGLLALQLLPLPAMAWNLAVARVELAPDLALAGVPVRTGWSLWPEATERSLYAVLPALACFLGAMAVGRREKRRLVQAALVLVLANLAFGVFQAGLPATSPMRLHTDNAGGFGGIFVNGNHQGTALIVGMLLALGLWGRQRRRLREGAERAPLKAAGYGAAALVCLAAVPLTGSSGAMLLALLGFGVGVLATGVVSLRRMRQSRRALAVGIAALAVLVASLVAASSWLDYKRVDAQRYGLVQDVASAGARHAPLGSGAGTFVDGFAQEQAPSLDRSEYVNHAHNEYVQWWFEAGWPGVALLLAGLGLVGVAGAQLLRARPRDPLAIASWLAVMAVLAHSWVDFPLRTISMMSMTGLLAGVALAAMVGHVASAPGSARPAYPASVPGRA